jgi:hypothetical protein
VEISRENALLVVGRLDRIHSYHRTLEAANYFSDGTESLSYIEITEKSGNILISEAVGGSVKNTLISDGTLYVWYGGGEAGIYEGEAGGDAAETLRSLISVDSVLALDQNDISYAGYEEFDGVPCICIEYVTKTHRYTERVYISVKTGLIMSRDSRDGEKLIYSLRSVHTDISTPDDAALLPPVSAARPY